jgi:hypothetical protein
MIVGNLRAEGRGKKILNTNLIGFLNFRSTELPTLDVFLKREWMLLRFGDWRGDRLIFWCVPDEAFEKSRLIRIGKVPRRPDDPTETPKVGWNWVGAVEVLEVVSTLPEITSSG